MKQWKSKATSMLQQAAFSLATLFPRSFSRLVCKFIPRVQLKLSLQNGLSEKKHTNTPTENEEKKRDRKETRGLWKNKRRRILIQSENWKSEAKWKENKGENKLKQKVKWLRKLLLGTDSLRMRIFSVQSYASSCCTDDSEKTKVDIKLSEERKKDRKWKRNGFFFSAAVIVRIVSKCGYREFNKKWERMNNFEIVIENCDLKNSSFR